MRDLTNRHAELAVVGHLLSDHREAGVLAHAAATLTPADFTDDTLRELFQTAIRLDAAGQPVDVITVGDATTVQGGGRSALTEAAQAVVAASTLRSLDHYCQILRNLTLLRRADGMCAGVRMSIAAGDVTAPEVVGLMTSNAVALASSDSTDRPVMTSREAVRELVMELTDLCSDNRPLECHTGLPGLDDIVGGMRGGHMIVLAGRPGSGKTTLALQVAAHNLRAGHPVLVFSLEMTARELVRKVVSSVSGISGSSLSGRGADWMADLEESTLTAAASQVMGWPLHLCDRGGLSIHQIRTIARLQQKTHGIRLVMIDYIGLIKTEQRKNSIRSQELGEVSRQCKEMAKELGVPVIVLSQMNRGIETKTRDPVLSDLRETGDLEQDADAVIFVHAPNPEQPSDRKIIVAKNRHGPTGDIFATMKGETSRIVQITRDDMIPAASKKKRDFEY